MLVSIWDEENKSSLINRIPASQSSELKKMYSARAELFHLDEESLFQILKKEKYSPVSVDNKIRNALWKMLDSVAEDKPLDFYDLSQGICTTDLIKHRYFRNAYAMAWVLCPPSSYYDMLEETVDMGLLQLKDVINTPHTTYNEAGEANHNMGLIEKKARIYSMLEDRLRGKVAQRIDMRAAHQHQLTGGSDARSTATAMLEGPTRVATQVMENAARELPTEGLATVDVKSTSPDSKQELQERLKRLKDQEAEILKGKV